MGKEDQFQVGAKEMSILLSCASKNIKADSVDEVSSVT